MRSLSTHTSRRLAVIPLALAALTAVAVTIAGGGQANAAEATVPLGTAASFAVLGSSTVTNTGATTISGDIGVSPGSAFTDNGTTTQVSGTTHIADAVASKAKDDATTAYTDAQTRPSSAAVTGPLGTGQVLTSGVYTGGALQLNGTLVLDAQGDPSAAFIFQASSTLTTASGSAIALINGADACNVFWQVTSSATIGTNTVFMGTVVASDSVTAQTGAFVRGRLIALTGAVTLDSNTVTAPSCDAAPATTVTVAGPTTTVTGPTVTAAGPTTTVTEAGPTTTVTAAGPTTTVTEAGPTTTVTAAGPTTTVTGPTVTAAGPTTTVTGPTVTAAGPTTTVATATVSVPGPTVTVAEATTTVSGSTTTVPGPTVTAAGQNVTTTVTVTAGGSGTDSGSGSGSGTDSGSGNGSGTDSGAAAGAGSGGGGGGGALVLGSGQSSGGLVFTGAGLGQGGGLANTGAPIRILISFGLACLLLGCMMVWSPRRRPNGHDHR
jgi:hypothetical protein